uniref:AB hydrolase-1 domain-containing protein n=1 Tax=Dracunculus medinensis TaxID=318479 RepID=A0A0N4UDC5_DRAME
LFFLSSNSSSAKFVWSDKSSKSSRRNSLQSPICLTFLDTLPIGSSIGTVVALHGAPGSHNDFKYMAVLFDNQQIRMIGINFPGYGYTSGNENIFFESDRICFVQQIVERLNLDKITFLGHSRGAVTAMKLGLINKVIIVFHL